MIHGDVSLVFPSIKDPFNLLNFECKYLMHYGGEEEVRGLHIFEGFPYARLKIIWTLRSNQNNTPTIRKVQNPKK